MCLIELIDTILLHFYHKNLTIEIINNIIGYLMIFRLFFSLLLSTLFTITLFANVVVSQESTAQTVQEEVIPFIELSAIPEEAVKSSSELNKMNDILQHGSESIDIHEVLPAYIKAVDTLLEDKVYQSLEDLSMREIQKLRQS